MADKRSLRVHVERRAGTYATDYWADTVPDRVRWFPEELKSSAPAAADPYQSSGWLST